MASEHIVTVTRSGEDDDVECTIECTDSASCDGWEECLEKHDPDIEPDDHDDEMVFHGVTHQYRWGHGWVLPLPANRCPVVEISLDFDAFQHLPSGRYLAEEEWDDTDLYLRLAYDPKPEQVAAAMAALGCRIDTDSVRGQRVCLAHSCHARRNYWRGSHQADEVCVDVRTALEAALNARPAPKETA